MKINNKYKIEKLTKPEQFNVGQLYMFQDWCSTLKKGFAKKVTETAVLFDDGSSLRGHTEIKFFELQDPSKDCFAAIFNPYVWRAIKEENKRHENTIKTILKGEYIPTRITRLSLFDWFKKTEVAK